MVFACHFTLHSISTHTNNCRLCSGGLCLFSDVTESPFPFISAMHIKQLMNNLSGMANAELLVQNLAS